jgi:paraquat-inducible protein B
MSKKANPTMVGMFVIGAVALVVAAVLIVAGDTLLQDRRQFVAVFEGSVKGLRVGANVVFRGVRVGYVTDINVVIDEEKDYFFVPVVFETIPTSVQVLSDGELRHIGSDDDRIGYEELIDRGLRAQLETESLLTGLLLIELELDPSRPAVYRAMDYNLPEIPTVPSQIQSLIRKVQTFAVEIGDKVDIGEVLQDLGSAIDGLDRFLNADDTQALTGTARTALQDFSNTMRSARSLVENADGKLGPVMDNLGPAIEALKATLDKAKETLAIVESQLQDDSEIATELANTLRELERAGRSVRVLADYLEQHPEALLKGKRNE